MDNNFYKNIIEKLNIAYAYHKVIYDKNGNATDYRFIEVNPAFTEYTGLKKEDIIGETITTILPNIKDDDFDWIKTYNDVAQGEGTIEFNQYSTPLKRWYHVKAFSLQKGYFITLFMDLFADVQTREKDLILHKNMSNLVSVAPIPIMIHAEDGEVITISREWKNITGYTLEDIPTLTDWTQKAYGENDYQSVLTFIKTLYDQKETLHDGEYIINTTSGQKRAWDFYSSYVGILPDGRRLAMSAAIDITDLVKAQDKARHEHQLAELYLQTTSQMMLVIDREGKVTNINEAGAKLLEDSKDNIIGKNWFDHFIEPEQKETVKAVFKKVLKQETDIPTDNENPIITTNNNQRIIAWKNTLLYDINETVVGILSSGHDITEHREYEKKLLEMSYKDQLTGLHNRRYYDQCVTNLTEQGVAPISLIMADINGLKLINDAFGHLEGDNLLKISANILKDLTPKDGELCRIGGDEFVIILPNMGYTEANLLLNTIREKTQAIDVKNIQLSISLGIATREKASDSMDNVFRKAEDGMYQAKLVDVPSMRRGAIDTIMTTLNEKDPYSEQHDRNVARYAERIAKYMELSHQDINRIHAAGLLHDIGKIIIPSYILSKKEKLTEGEYETMKTHPEIGFRILSSTADMRDIATIVLNHHEHYDGSGYPQGVARQDIPLMSRILAVADAYDAMTTERLYRKTFTKEAALKELQDYAGTQFDPDIIDIFVKHFNDITSDS